MESFKDINTTHSREGGITSIYGAIVSKDSIVPLFPIPFFVTSRRVMKPGSADNCVELILLKCD